MAQVITVLRKWWYVPALLIVAGLYVNSGQSGTDAAPAEEGLSRAMPVHTTTVEIEDGYFARRSFTGRAVAGQTSSLSFELGGQIKSIHVDLGEQVEVGTLIAQLDTARLSAARRQMVAQLDEAEANLKLANKTLKRTQTTFKQGHVSAQRLDETEARAIALEAQVNRLAAQVETIDVDLTKSDLRAPYAGSVTARFLDEGAVVSAGRPVIEISEVHKLEAHIGVAPKYADAVAKNNDAIRLLDIDRQIIRGVKIRSIVPVISGETRTKLITFDLPEGSVTRGELITALVEDWQDQSGAWLPLRSLNADIRGLWRVYKVSDGPEGPHVRFENVQVLYTDGNRVFVTGTLSAGDKIIADGLDRLAPGQRVTMIGDPVQPSR